MTCVTSAARPSRIALVGWPIGALVGALLAALLVGALVAALVLSGGQDRDGWEDLAAVASGMVAAAAVAVIAWVLLLVLGARRLFPRGRRTVPVLLTLGAGAVAAAGAVWVTVVVGAEAELPGATLVLPVLVAVLSGAVFPGWQRRLDRADAEPRG